MNLENKAVIKENTMIQRLDYGEIKLQGEMGRRIAITREKNIQVLNIFKNFLDAYYNYSGEGYWAGAPLGGMFLDALVQHAAYSNDAKTTAIKECFVKALLETQRDDGYIGVGGEWDIHEGAYIIIGLVHNYEMFGCRNSLSSACKLADYWIANGDGVNTIGWENALLELYKFTGNENYIQYACNTLGLPEWKEAVFKDDGHVYAVLARAVAQLDLYLLEHDNSFTERSFQILAFLLNKQGLFSNGTCGEYYECWQYPIQHAGSAHGWSVEGPSETCSTAYLLRWYDRMIRNGINPLYGDLMERSVFNGLYAAQSPDGRQIRYNTAFSGERYYFPYDYMCCPGNYRRIIVELARMVYYYSSNDVYVNLYTTSEASIPINREQILNIHQKTEYPMDEKVEIFFEPSSTVVFNLKLRIPLWCENAGITLNGKLLTDIPEPGSFYVIHRTWVAGDTITLTLPMKWRWVRGIARQDRRFALLRGPQLYCFSAKNNPGVFSIKENLDSNVQQILSEHLILRAVINPQSLEDSLNCKGDGIYTVRAKAWSNPSKINGKEDIDLVLSTFPDPDGICSYFNSPDTVNDLVSDDELYGKVNEEKSIWFLDKIRNWR